MSAFEELKNRTGGTDGATPLEWCVVEMHKSYNPKRAEQAAEELAAKDDELTALRERVEALGWVAKRLEFIYADDVIDAYLCPICRGEKPTHYVDCELAAALRRRK